MYDNCGPTYRRSPSRLCRLYKVVQVSFRVWVQGGLTDKLCYVPSDLPAFDPAQSEGLQGNASARCQREIRNYYGLRYGNESQSQPEVKWRPAEMRHFAR